MSAKKKRRLPEAGEDPATAAAARPSRRLAGILGGLLLLVYLANGDTLANHDASASVYLPLQLLGRGRLTFTLEDSPQLFTYELRRPSGKTQGVRFHSWDFVLDGATMRQHAQAGALLVTGRLYCLTETRWPGIYANTFGIGAGLFALPAVAVAKLFDPALQKHPPHIWQATKFAAAAAVAGSAVFVFLVAAAALGSRRAFLLALIYGLCTCVWSTSSQALWQHGPTELFLAMGCYFLLRRERPSAFWAGIAFSLAVACRPTAILVLAAVALMFALRDRRALVRLVAGALPVGVLLLVYGLVIFGHAFSTGQTGMGSEVALGKTGSADLWQTPLYLGSLGLFVSPGRGLLVYSPVAVVALGGMLRVWRDRKEHALQALSLAAVVMFVLAAKWFDWWGGWCYGYRPIVDLTILLAFLAVLVVPWVCARRGRRLVVLVLAGWSFLVQALGAYAYDVSGWNGRWAYDVVGPGPNQVTTYYDPAQAKRHARERGGSVKSRSESVDDPAYRHRLWSVSDNPIFYYLSRLQSSHARRLEGINTLLVDGT